MSEFPPKSLKISPTGEQVAIRRDVDIHAENAWLVADFRGAAAMAAHSDVSGWADLVP